MNKETLKNFTMYKNSCKIRENKKYTIAKNEIETYVLNYIKNKENLNEIDILELYKIEIFNSLFTFTIYTDILIVMLKYTFEIDIQKNILYIKKLNYKNNMHEVIEKIENFIY